MYWSNKLKPQLRKWQINVHINTSLIIEKAEFKFFLSRLKQTNSTTTISISRETRVKAFRPKYMHYQYKPNGIWYLRIVPPIHIKDGRKATVADLCINRNCLPSKQAKVQIWRITCVVTANKQCLGIITTKTSSTHQHMNSRQYTHRVQNAKYDRQHRRQTTTPLVQTGTEMKQIGRQFSPTFIPTPVGAKKRY
jgi:hypothetical protein